MNDEINNDVSDDLDNDIVNDVSDDLDSNLDNDLETTETTEEEQQPERTKLTDAALKAVNKKHFLYKEEERKRMALEQELAQLKAQYVKKEPDIPPMPDYYDPDFDEKVKARDDAIKSAALTQMQQAQMEAMRYQQEQLAHQEQLKILKQSEAALISNASKAGITEQELIESAQTLAAYGLSGDIGMALLNDPDGALMINYLGKNADELERIAAMTPYQAGTYIATTVRAKIGQLRPKSTQAPRPAAGVTGQGAANQRYPHSAGVTFE